MQCNGAETRLTSDCISSGYHSYNSVGKLLPGALYVHKSLLTLLPSQLLVSVDKALKFCCPNHITLVKFHLNHPCISFLHYPDFDTDAHPALHRSIKVDFNTGKVREQDFRNSPNPPVLHRKETFVTPDYPHYEIFAELTRQEEALGLLKDSRLIGTRLGWQRRLDQHGVRIEGHQVIHNFSPRGKALELPTIHRHRAALPRKELSKPVRCAIEAGLFTTGATFFDYGCGFGGDHTRIAQLGFAAEGWDPYYRPEAPLLSANIVNLGYVINVIEELAERNEALLKAWNLTQNVLIVSAQVLVEDATRGHIAYGDGIITRRNTFQKYYGQEELKDYIEQVLGVDAIPVALGIYFVFRDETQAQTFRASRFRSHTTTPRVRKQVKRFEDYRQLLTPLIDFVTERGRMPVKGELASETEIISEFNSLRKAFQVILQVTDQQEWDKIAEQRRQDLMLYLALTNFGQRPKFSQLSIEIQEDIKAFFGSYRQALIQSDTMLRSLGNLNLVAEKCRNSPIGRVGTKSLMVHISALPHLDPILRLYESCASRTIGRPTEATLVKFHNHQPKIAYLFYPEFDTEPHPALQTYMEIDLRDLHVRYQDFDTDDNPPILHRKENLVTPDYPFYQRFAKLTQQEENWGLLDDEQRIRRQQGWLKCLEEHCAILQGHRVVWHKGVDRYRRKILQSQINARKRISTSE